MVAPVGETDGADPARRQKHMSMPVQPPGAYRVTERLGRRCVDCDQQIGGQFVVVEFGVRVMDRIGRGKAVRQDLRGQKGLEQLPRQLGFELVGRR